VDIKYAAINLDSAMLCYSEKGVKNMLSSFSCELNCDIENFLIENAIKFSNQGIAKTHLILRKTDDGVELLGYYSLANKVLSIPSEPLSKSLRKRIDRFGILDISSDSYNVPMPLIAQLGKNYTNELNKSMSGDDLLQTACDKVAEIQGELGGRFVFLECEDNVILVDFYIKNGFRLVEKEYADGELLQMLRYQ
jgi:hypothetical protein